MKVGKSCWNGERIAGVVVRRKLALVVESYSALWVRGSVIKEVIGVGDGVRTIAVVVVGEVWLVVAGWMCEVIEGVVLLLERKEEMIVIVGEGIGVAKEVEV
jgi:hypothetical protein